MPVHFYAGQWASEEKEWNKNKEVNIQSLPTYV